MRPPDRFEVLELLRRIQASPLGDRLILAGSSGMYGVSETIPAFGRIAPDAARARLEAAGVRPSDRVITY